MKLKDQTVIVTGSGRGIGKAIALSVSRQGARVALVARTEKELRDTQKQIRADGGKAICIFADIRDRTSVQAMVEEVLRQYETVDILVNNAGVCFAADVVDCTDEQWEETLQTNLTGLFYCSRAVLPHLLKKKSGQIINVVSGGGVHAFPGAAAYCASKFGVMGFSESLLEEVRSHGIRVTVVLPGMVDTAMVKDDRYAQFQKLAPEDVAEAVLYAASVPKDTLISRVEVRHVSPREG